MKFKFIPFLFFLSLYLLGAQETQSDGLQTEDAPAAAENPLPVESVPQAAAGGEILLDDLPESPIDAQDELQIPASLKNNTYYLESLKMSNLARLSYSEGDYDQSAWYSAEATRLALLSDEYISDKMKSSRGIARLLEAQKRLEWAESSGAAEYYPKEVEQAKTDFNEAVEARKTEDWDNVIVWAEKVFEDLDGVAAPPPKGSAPPNLPELPTQYKVRPWDKFGDCFWNISKWFYGTPWRWPVLYKANKHKIPDENNPDLIEIGTVIDIPSLTGEQRIGMYDTGIRYAAGDGKNE